MNNILKNLEPETTTNYDSFNTSSFKEKNSKCLENLAKINNIYNQIELEKKKYYLDYKTILKLDDRELDLFDFVEYYPISLEK